MYAIMTAFSVLKAFAEHCTFYPVHNVSLLWVSLITLKITQFDRSEGDHANTVKVNLLNVSSCLNHVKLWRQRCVMSGGDRVKCLQGGSIQCAPV